MIFLNQYITKFQGLLTFTFPEMKIFEHMNFNSLTNLFFSDNNFILAENI